MPTPGLKKHFSPVIGKYVWIADVTRPWVARRFSEVESTDIILTKNEVELMKALPHSLIQKIGWLKEQLPDINLEMTVGSEPD